MTKLVLLRHGESIWNRENLFTGWTDVDLTEKGIIESMEAAKILKKEGFAFSAAYTSVLKRAIRTLWIVLEEMDLMWLPVHRSWRLNERHYGALQGLNKAQTAQKYGDEQVHIWRRSYDVRPPELNETDPRNPASDPKYRDVDPLKLPLAECLKDTVVRFMPYWESVLVPEIKKGKQLLIAAHGNSLRALVKQLNSIPDQEIPSLNIPTGVPLVYELDSDLKPLRSYYLGDPEQIKAATDAVRKQGEAKG